jgi:hypothetical protein
MISYFPVVTGSLTVSGSVNISGGITASGGISISGSIASASYAASASNALAAQSASYVLTAQTASYVLNAQSASNAVVAQTSSYANNLTVAGTLTAQTLVVQTITSSVDFITGSTRFGTLLSNTHVFSGSVTMNPNGLFVSSSGVVGIGTTTPATPLHLLTSGLPAIRLTLGSEARVHNINGINNGRDLNVLPFRTFALQTGNGIAEGQIVLNAYEDFIVGTGASYTTRLTIASTGAATFSNNVTLTNSVFPVLSVIGTVSSPHIGSTWTVSANQDGNGRTIIGTAGQGRAMYFENNGDISIPNTSLSVGGSIFANGTLRLRNTTFSQINSGASQTVTIISAPGATAFRSLQVVVIGFEQTNSAIIQLKFDIIARWSGASLVNSGIGNIVANYSRGIGDFVGFSTLTPSIGTSGNAVTLTLANSSGGYINNIIVNITENSNG